jgi:hypothetical protein
MLDKLLLFESRIRLFAKLSNLKLLQGYFILSFIEITIIKTLLTRVSFHLKTNLIIIEIIHSFYLFIFIKCLSHII